MLFANLLSFTDVWYVLKWPVFALMILCALFIILVVMMQPSNDSGISALSGQQSDSFLTKNKSKTFEHKMKVITVISSIIFAVLCIVFAILINFVD